MNLKDRIGIDIGRRAKLEDGIEWAAKHGVRFIDIQLDTAANAITTFDDRRAAGVRAACEKHGIQLGLHTLSAVNVAEYSPYVSDAVERLSESLYRHLSEARRELDRRACRLSLQLRQARCGWKRGSSG